MLRQEDSLLQTIEHVNDPTDDEMDDYAIQLAEFLDRKEALLMSLQKKLVGEVGSSNVGISMIPNIPSRSKLSCTTI